MEVKVESKIGTLQGSAERIFSFLADVSRMAQLMPQEKIKTVSHTSDECIFEAEMVGKVVLRVVNREPYKTIKYSFESEKGGNFFFWIQLLEPQVGITKVKLTLKTEMNAFMKLVAEKPLKKMLDEMVDKFTAASF